MNFKSLVHCPICQNKEFSEFLSCTDFFTTKEIFDLKSCKNCGFVFTQDFPSEAFIGKYYEVSDYISHSDTKTGIVNYLYHSARQYMLRSKCDLIERVSGLKKGTLLDYGSGTGYFLHAISNRGWKSIGVEKSEIGREFSLREFGLQISEPSSLNKIESESIDVITLWHVFEHVEDPEGLLVELKRILKQDGVLILALPNSASFDANYYQEFWAAYDVPRHLWHFTPSTLELLTKKFQLKLIEKRGMPFDAFYISMLSEKNRGNRFSFIRGMCVGFVAFLMSLRDVSKQSSVIYILKK